MTGFLLRGSLSIFFDTKKREGTDDERNYTVRKDEKRLERRTNVGECGSVWCFSTFYCNELKVRSATLGSLSSAFPTRNIVTLRRYWLFIVVGKNYPGQVVTLGLS